MEEYIDDLIYFKNYPLQNVKENLEYRDVNGNLEPYMTYTFTFKVKDGFKSFTYEEGNPKLFNLLNVSLNTLKEQKKFMEKNNEELMNSINYKVNVKRVAYRAGLSLLLMTLNLVGLNAFFSLPNTFPPDVAQLITTIGTLFVGGGTYYLSSPIKPKPSKLDQNQLKKIAKNFDKNEELLEKIKKILKTNYGYVTVKDNVSSLTSNQKFKYYETEDEIVYKK